MRCILSCSSLFLCSENQFLLPSSSVGRTLPFLFWFTNLPTYYIPTSLSTSLHPYLLLYIPTSLRTYLPASLSMYVCVVYLKHFQNDFKFCFKCRILSIRIRLVKLFHFNLSFLLFCLSIQLCFKVFSHLGRLGKLPFLSSHLRVTFLSVLFFRPFDCPEI